MANGGGIVWKAASAVLAIVVVGATVCVYERTNDVQALRQQLAAAASDAKRAHEDNASLKQQLGALQAQAASQQQQLSTDQNRLADAQERQAATNQQLLASLRPDLPIRLSFHRGVLTEGEVATLVNFSGRTLEIALDVDSPTGEHFHHTVVINPGRFIEFGQRQGWAFASGQLVTLSNPGYRPIKRMVS